MRSSYVSIDDPCTCHEDQDARSLSFFADRDRVRVDEPLLRELKDRAGRNGGSARLCLHRRPDEALHESVLVTRYDRFCPPHRHPTKAETYHLLEGEVLVLTFDGKGLVTDACRLDGRQAFVYRVGAGFYHVSLPVTRQVVVLECTVGPYRRDQDLDVAPWAPAPADRKRYLTYRKKLLARHLKSG